MKLVLLALALVSTSAFALTLKEKQQVKAWNEEIVGDSGYSASVKEKCGVSIPLTMEDKFATPFMEANTSASSYCMSAQSAIATMCADATAKTEIAKRIKKIDCKLGEKEKVSMKLNGSTLEFTVGLNASNLDDKVKEWLGNNL